MRAKLRPSAPTRRWPWVRYYAGRLLQVTGLMVALVAATAFFGTSSTTSMLRMMLAGVVIFVPGWLLARGDPDPRNSPQRHEGHKERRGSTE